MQVDEYYSPIAHGEAVKDPTVAAVAEKTGVSAAQLCIKYVLQHGLVALPKASSRAHIRDNAALAFTISPEDMARLDALDFHDHGEYSFSRCSAENNKQNNDALLPLSRQERFLLPRSKRTAHFYDHAKMFTML